MPIGLVDYLLISGIVPLGIGEAKPSNGVGGKGYLLDISCCFDCMYQDTDYASDYAVTDKNRDASRCDP